MKPGYDTRIQTEHRCRFALALRLLLRGRVSTITKENDMTDSRRLPCEATELAREKGKSGTIRLEPLRLENGPALHEAWKERA
ncbi:MULTISPECIES: hypothetical protein [unclassified Rhizobium]|uniref:hypothetical protein n=1 Tax=unclassified Rhizobium TaxID=2613769 RepID=UPI0006F3EDF8|nr:MULTISPECIES: hypothetical protein [unclassified Rhizobium]KQV39158.1 hypothetical protein ASC86_23105 [Rhizobium sp. Root1212]KRD35132.1 hypothetical protein ASE37_21675 [Rhizobium sp. Root268]